MRITLSLVAIASLFCTSAATLAQVPSNPGDWPQWRGPNRDGISQEKGLLKEWPKAGPKLLWQVDTVGVGYSSLSVKGDRIYTQGDLDGVEHTICLDAKDGRVIWAVQPMPVAKLLTSQVEKDFQQADKNKDGKIDELEALARFGWDWNRFNKPLSQPIAGVARARVKTVLTAFDKDSDGKLTYVEADNRLRERLDRIDREDKTADAKALADRRTADYMKLDTDADSRVSKKEAKGTWLDRQFDRFDERPQGADKGDELLSAAEIAAALVKHERGLDGVITTAELEKYYEDIGYSGDSELSLNELRGMTGGLRDGMGDGPRGTPTVDGERIYAEGGNGDVTCLEAATGKTIWHINLSRDFGGGRPGWGYCESPLIVGELVIVTPGGQKGTVLALNKLTGEKVWQSSDVKDGAHYASPTLATINGVKQIVQFSGKHVFGVTLADGKPLWQYEGPANGTANCCDPIIEGNLVFASSDYGTGGGLAKIVESGSTQQAEQVYFQQRMQCHHGGMIKIGDHVYSNAGGELLCMEFKTGKIAWQARNGTGKGSLVAADGMLYLLSEGHQMALAEATPDAYREHGRFKISDHGRASWAHPIVAGGRLYIRDQESLSAYDLRQ